MLEDKKLEESKRIIKTLISEGKITKPKEEVAGFFMKKSLQSIAVASRLLELEDEEGLTTDMWVVNASYYSMFFAATSLLAKFKHKIKTEAGIHKLTYHALVYFFVIEDNKINKHFLEEYKDAFDEAEELLQLSEKKTEKMIRDFDNEMYKRKIFTYNLGKIAERTKAETSLQRAKDFVKEIEGMLR